MRFKLAEGVFCYPFFRVVPFLFIRKNSISYLNKHGDFSAIAALSLFLLYFLRDYFFVQSEPVFDIWALADFFSQLFLIGLFVYLVSKSAEILLRAALILSLLIETIFIVWLVNFVVSILIIYTLPTFNHWELIHALFYAWELIAVAGIFLIVCGSNLIAARGYVLTYFFMVNAPLIVLNLFSTSLWHQDYSSYSVAPYQNYDYEKIFYGQGKLVHKALEKVAEGVPATIELFYLGVASYGSQDVFKKEIFYMQQLFRDQAEGHNRGLILLNHASTIEAYPLAIKRNIELALVGLEQKMDPEDILFFYLTSHGSKEHELAVDLRPFRFSHISTEDLKLSLDTSGIKWKIVVVSACYSGGFIEPLKDDYSIIATASDAESTSFGCGDMNEFTYYGEAIFRDQLAKGVPIMEALAEAINIIGRREKAENITASNPQLWIGEKIRNHMTIYHQQ